ncbi:MAG: alpha/beta fold hydrolase [Vicingaceae bacterium]
MKLNYKVFGEGQPLIILHGLFGSLDNWQTIAKHLSEHFKVYIVDQRNHGQSPHSDVFNYEVMAADLFEFITDHQLLHPIILGHSMGGKTTMQFAVNHPQIPKKIVVVDIAPKQYPVHHQQIIAGMEAIDFNHIHSRKEAEEILKKYIPENAVRQFILKNIYWKDKNRLAFRFNLEAIKNNIEKMGESLKINKPFDKPALFIKGALSNYILKSDEPLIKEFFPKARFVSFKNVGHWVHAEVPEAFEESVKRFCLKV